MAPSTRAHFEASTQWRRWTLAPTTLAKRRQALASKDYDARETSLLQQVDAHAQQLDVERRVRYSALVFVKRYALSCIWTARDESVLSCAVLFLALKARSSFMPLHRMLAVLKDDALVEQQDAIIRVEMEVARALQFDFEVHDPYLPLYGFFILNDTLWKRPDASQLYDAAAALLDRAALTTDLALTAFPSQIGNAALRVALNQAAVDVDLQPPSNASVDKAMAILQEHALS